MRPALVFNELSLQAPATDVYKARRYMADLITTANTASKLGTDSKLRTYSDFEQLEIAPGYRVYNWRNDNEVDLEQRRRLKGLTSKSPFLDSLTDGYSTYPSSGEEVLFLQSAARGLGAALWLAGLALSFASAPVWSTAHINVTVRTLEESGELSEEVTSVRHASEGTHVAAHTTWINESAMLDIGRGAQLWDARAEVFPHLKFCDSVREHLSGLPDGNPALGQVVKRLRELDEYTGAWITGPFDPDAIRKATPESEATIDQYGDVRTFTCPDDKSRVFSWHVRCTPGTIRIHFLPIEHSIIIGYIGPHLPTVKFN